MVKFLFPSFSVPTSAFLQKVFYDAVDANQYPKKFYDESRKVKTVKKRNYDEGCANCVEKGISEHFAFDFADLQKNVSADN